MKRIFVIPMIVAMLSSYVYADNKTKDDNGSSRVSAVVTKQFQSDFADATNVSWTVGAELQKVDFTMNGERMSAFYKLNGKYMGLTHLISASAIPARTMKQIQDNYAGYNVGDVIVYQTNEEENPDVDPVAYFVDLKNTKHEVLLRITQNADIELFKQIK